VHADLLTDRYRIVSPLGAGGMGEVFLAEDVRLERRVAVKLLPSSTEADPVARERLRREALAAAALDHPFICKVHEIGEAAGRMFVVMEYVEGETLHAAARRELMPTRQVIEVAHQLAQALDAAHRRNILHRDLKPANVMVTPQGHVKVMDFGLAKQLVAQTSGSGVAPAIESDGATGGARLTDVGTRLGTPAYMSPEQVLGASLDPRSDVFSLGVILYELATGSHPFLRETPADTMAAILRDAPRPGPRDAESVGGLGATITRMLSKACAERHQSMAEVLVDFEALRERAWSSSAPAGGVQTSGPAERTPFIGREAESSDLEKALDRMLTGQGGIVLIGGEPGVGKTRLVRELLAKARQRGCVALAGHCYEMEGAPPFVPFVEIVEQTVRLVPQGARAAMGEFAAEIAAMVPSLRRAYSDIPPLPEVPAEQQRRLIFSAFLEYIRRGSQKSPGVFLFDDLHWADEPTLQLLLHTAPHLASMRLLVVGTYRDVELDVKRPFAKTLESLLRQRLASRVTLRRLNESGVQQMLTAMAGAPAPSGLAQAVFRETEGNPFFVEEVYQHLAEEGKLFDDSGAWKTGLRVDTIEVPEGVRLVIGRRLDRLGDQARKVLTAAAVIGRMFPLDLLRASVDASEDEVLDAVEEAERAQLVQADGSQRVPRYSFVHELIRTTLVNALSLPRRQRLHLKIADALERLHAASLESHASVLAHHLYQAGAAADTQRAARALTGAAKRALGAGAFEEALEICEQVSGLELADTDPFLAVAHEQRAHALTGVGRHDESAAEFSQALTIYISVNDDGGIRRAAAGEANVRAWSGQHAASLAPLERGLKALSRNALAERAQLLAWLGTSRISPGHIKEAEAYMAEAMELSAHVEDPAVLASILFAKGGFDRFCCEYKSALANSQRALELTPANALWERAQLLGDKLVIDFYFGDLEACDRIFPEIESVSVRAGHHGTQFLGQWIAMFVALCRTGNARACLEVSDKLLGFRLFRYLLGGVSASMRLCLGEVEEALSAFERVLPGIPADNWMFGLGHGNLLTAYALAGRHERARALFDTAGAWLPASGQRNAQGAFYGLAGAVLGLTISGDRERCAALYPLTLEYVNTGQVLACLMAGPNGPQLAAALAADAAGVADRAREHFETALREAREVPFRLMQPMVLFLYGRSLIGAARDGDRARGRGMIEAAIADFRVVEMPLHANLAERLLRDR
jgi:tetratricopeptide (TPR) repeat protein